MELVNWVEIPVNDMARARTFYERVFECELVDLLLGDAIYPCFPDKNGDGFGGALVQYEFTKPGREGPLVYLNSYGRMDALLLNIKAAGGKVIEEKREIAPGYGYFAIFEDSEGNVLALQGEN